MRTLTEKVRYRLRVVVFFCFQFVLVAHAAPLQLLPGHVPAGLDKLKPVGRLEANRELRLAIALPLRNRDELTNLLQRIYNPASPEFRHYLTPSNFAWEFGPSESDYRSVAAFAQAHGLRVTGTYSNRTLLDVSGSVSDIENALHVTLRTYRHPKENRLFFAPDSDLSVDTPTRILHISGLDDYLEPRPMSLVKKPQSAARGAVATGSGPTGTFMGNDFRAAYVPSVTLTGAGQSVALLEFDGYYTTDISNYESVAGIPGVTLTNVYVDGVDGSPGRNNLEVALDIDMSMCMAPGLSSVIVYEGQVGDDILNKMATDAVAAQLSSSWIFPIDPGTEQIFQQFAAQGESFFNASGDSDAWLGIVSTPCDDPNITIVGGTTLTTTGPGGSWASETVWNWGIEYGQLYDGIGSGGGISGAYTIPSWQESVSMASNQGSSTFRDVPDVAMAADNVFTIADDGQQQNVGGTSCAAPLWAGLVALANQQAASHGRPSVGFVNPAIYSLAQSLNYSNCFHDITTGNNTWSQSPSRFFAVTGFDLCTGWGTPTGSNLLSLLALDSLQITPPDSWSPSGMAGGPFDSSFQTYVLTNTGTAPLYWAIGSSAPWLDISVETGSLTPGGSSATVVASLNFASAGLLPGIYDTMIWFTNVTDGTVQSRTVSLSIIKPPVIVAQPTNVVTIGGATVELAATVAGGIPLYCRWQFNGTNLDDGPRISGSQFILSEPGSVYESTTSILIISNVVDSDAGSYSLVASNAAGVAISSFGELTVMPSAPIIIAQPASQNALVGATAQFHVAADGTTPFTYQWRQDGTNLSDGAGISGALTPDLTISGVSSAGIGTYSVVVSNTISATVSDGAILNVLVAVPGGQVVQNGGFETGSFYPWQGLDNQSESTVTTSSTAVHSGVYGALLKSAGTLAYLSQPLQTVAGQSYLVSLWLNSPDGLAPNEFQVSWNGAVLFDQTNLGVFGWTNLQFYVQATNTNSVIQIGFRDDNGLFGLDDVQVVEMAGAAGAPIIATQPVTQAAVQGGLAAFAVLSSGQLPLSYQWQFNGATIDNATNATLVLSNLTPVQAGSYAVVVSNSLGYTTSSNAVLSVIAGQYELITFDDLPYRLVPIPPGYNNLTWSNFNYLNAVVSHASGYTAGMVSIPKVAYNVNGTPAVISALSPFALFSAYLTAAWNDNLHVEAQGYSGTNLIYDNTYSLSASEPTRIQFNYVGVTSVNFISSGGTPHRGYNGSGTQFAVDNVSAYVTPIPSTPPPASMVLLHSFSGFDGGRPVSSLTQGVDGNLYGTTEYGGDYGLGTVFRMTTNGAISTLYSFAGPDGGNPTSGLVQGSDGNLYGTSTYGGTNNDGVVFELSTNGAFSTIASFSLPVTGGYPASALIQGTDGNFYGVAPFGGTYGDGTVFSVGTNGVITTIQSFSGGNGLTPYGPLVQGGDGSFYGTTLFGGAYSVGTVFSLTTNGAIITIASLNGLNAYPSAGVIQGSDGKLYGTSEYGGSEDFGTVFSVTTNGVVSTLASFDYYTTGGYPAAALIQGDDGTLYGTTSGGGSFGTVYFNGTYGGGTVFSITPSGQLTTLFDFQNTNGMSSQSGLVFGLDGNLYGTASFGGVGFNGYYDSGDGVAFRIGTGPSPTSPAVIAQPASQVVPIGGKPTFIVNARGASPLGYSWRRNGSPIAGATQSRYVAESVSLTNSGDQYGCVISNGYGTAITSNGDVTVIGPSGTLAAFDGPHGGYPIGALIQDVDGSFYGTTQYGGANGDGTVFKMSTDGSVSTIASFNFYMTGANPVGALLNNGDGSFYGTTPYGGMHGVGTVFRVTTDGMLTTVYAFSGGDGSEPCCTLLRSGDGGFYGTTVSGGTYQYGTVFKLTPGGVLTMLHAFGYSDGGEPESALVPGADGALYGTTVVGGASSLGTVFRITTNGNFSTLLSFGGTNGAAPQGALVQLADGNFYGLASEGGISNYGTVFRMSSNGVASTLLLFDGVNGAYPQGNLIAGADGNFYGATSQGGEYNRGTVFSITTNGIITNLFSFSGRDGSYPGSGLIQALDGNFYGTAAYGGLGYDGISWSGNGTVFRITGVLPAGPPVIVSQPENVSAIAGNSAAFSVAAASSTPLSYAWQRNGTNIPGATQYTYVTNGVQLSDSGSVFDCIVGNANGFTRSGGATLSVVSGTPGLITFDELSGAGVPVPFGYANLEWDNFDVANAPTFGEPSGFAVGVVSTNNAAYNYAGGTAAIDSPSSFNLVSAYLTAAWDDDLEVEVQGYKGSEVVYDNIYVVGSTSPTLISFNYQDITSVEFIPSGGVQHAGFEGVGNVFIIDNISLVQVPAPVNPGPLPPARPFGMMYSFGGNDGGHPGSGMVVGVGGNLYGVTEYGGADDDGTVFQLSTNGGLSTMASFAGVNGAGPQGGLVAGGDGTLYGVTAQGGGYGLGTVYSVSAAGVLKTLYSFGGSDGAGPKGGLLQDVDGNFYGTTAQGGAFSQGTVFRLGAGGALTTLHSFDGEDGAYPYGALARGADGNLYGTTESGGTNGDGTVFRMTGDGTVTTVASLDYNATGGYPSAGLLEGADGNLYGTTEFGGTNGEGTVFRITPGGALQVLYAFDNITGAEPYGALMQGSDGFIYGTTEYGGTNQGGTVFGMTTNGYVVSLYSFGGANGYYPQAGLVEGPDGNLYGTARYGGEGFNGYYNSGDGVVYRMGAMGGATAPAIIAQPAGQIVPVGGAPYWSVTAGGAGPLSYTWQRNGVAIAGATRSSYGTNNVQLGDSGAQFSCVVSNAYGAVTTTNAALTLFSGSGSIFGFDGANGGYPTGGVMEGTDGNYYGTTQYGGLGGNGTVYSLTSNGLLNMEISFNGENGAQPGGGLVEGAGGNFYGTTQDGGTYQNGTVFRMSAAGELTTLVSFEGTNGAGPGGGLVEGADGNYYGTTQEGGANGYGTVFSLTTNGTLTTLVSFNQTNGSSPEGNLIQGSDGNFYGVTQDGGDSGYGTVFSVTTNGMLTTLASFMETDGAYPQGGLVEGADGGLYGTTQEGGANGYGTVFRITTNGTLTSLMSFNGANGQYPQGGLIQGGDGNLYGTTTEGGLYGEGAVFGMSTNGEETGLYSLEGINGGHPDSGVIQGRDGNLYGTALYGGLGYDGIYWSGNGVVFRLSSGLGTGAPLIVTQPANQTVPEGEAAVFTVVAASSTPVSYQWQWDGTNIPGASLSVYTIDAVEAGQSGAEFSCLVSNAYAAIQSSNALLTVGAPSLVQNGGFELGTFADWTTSGNFLDCGVVSIAPFVHSGKYGAELGPVGSFGYLSQTLSTTPGELYEIAFWVNSGGLTPNEFSVAWSGAIIFDQQNLNTVTWTRFQLDAAAWSTNTLLTFGFRDDPSYFGLDDVAVYPIGLAPPEIQSVTLINGAVNLGWGASVGQTYQVQTTTNLVGGDWAALGDSVTATNPVVTVSEAIGVSREQFYRLVLVP